VVTSPETGQAASFGGVFAGRRVLVTGHTGFKGSWLSLWLGLLGGEVSGYALAPPTDPSLFVVTGLADTVDHTIGDVRDRAALRAAVAHARPEMIFHLAAQPLVRRSYEDPVETYETNVMGLVNLFEAVRACPTVRVVVIVTSDKCYENRERERAYAEDDPMGGHDPYSSSKGCAELVTAAYRRSYFGPASTVRVASARAGNVIGGGDWAVDRVVPDCVRALAAGVPVTLRHPGAVRPWQHVLESLSGYLWRGARRWTDGPTFDGAWNFGPDAAGELPVTELVEAFHHAWGDGSWRAAEAGEDVHEAARLTLDTRKAAAELGWRPVWGAGEAAAVAARWYHDFYEGGRRDAQALRRRTESDIVAYASAARAQGLAWCASPGAGGE
jgi:CDP-glucose 4,6-dehydratase